MSIKEIESAIEQLSNKEVSELSVWLADYRASLWDNQIASDLDAGRLDEVLDQVDAEYKAGKAEPL
jgi:hypothetical protein